MTAISATPLLSRILTSLSLRGYHYEPSFGPGDDGGAELVRLARAFGEVFVAGGMDPDLPVLVTEPTADAPPWKPFDHPERIGWHNDFSTLADRPVLSLAWIARGDPTPGLGDWRAASCADVLDVLSRDSRVSLERLRREPLPFGYTDGGEPSLLPVVRSTPGEAGREELRFYGRALREGALACFGSIPAETERLVMTVEQAADAVGETLAASTGALLVCHNGLSLHDRTEQTTEGGRPFRKSVLCFVERLRGRGLSSGPDGEQEG
ncbi:MAG TPA: TauD/TfdA family dioxygenase [Thermoanaerobaculia bacterium]|nr:TauD/TfdA family dioxygenase [Thermoanaerobaculia bacterium]